jgi:hypothetical protein
MAWTCRSDAEIPFHWRNTMAPTRGAHAPLAGPVTATKALRVCNLAGITQANNALNAVRRVRDFPTDWRELNDADLFALSWST